VFFSGGGGIGTDNPVLGPFPRGTQAADRIQQGGRRQWAVTEPLLVTDGGQEFQGPVALRLAKGAWALMQDRLQVLPLLGCEHRGQAHGHMGPMPQTVQVSLGKGIEDIVDCLACTSQVASNRGGRLPLGARQQNMASPYCQGIRGTTTVFQRRALI